MGSPRRDGPLETRGDLGEGARRTEAEAHQEIGGEQGQPERDAREVRRPVGTHRRHILTTSHATSRYPLAMPPEVTILLGAALVFLGFVVGAFGTLIGAGGGFLLVPLLLIGYHFPPADAVGTSLSLVFLNAASGSFAYLRQRRVDLQLGWKFAAATIPGAIGGAYLTRAMSSNEFSLAFGVLLVLIAVLLFSGITAAPSARAGARRIVDTSGAAHVYHVDAWKGVVVSLLVGILSSVFGIGGGIIHVPFLIVVLSLPVHVATATSHFVLSISTLVGAGTFFALGHVDLTTTALMGAGIRAGAQLGARVSVRTRPVTIRRMLAVALALVGIRMVLHGLAVGPW